MLDQDIVRSLLVMAYGDIVDLIFLRVALEVISTQLQNRQDMVMRLLTRWRPEHGLWLA